MEALKLTIELADFMAAPQMPFHLDSLCHALVARRLGLMEAREENQAAIHEALGEVLARDESDPKRVYRASVFRSQGRVAHHQIYLIRRNDLGDVAENQLKGFLKRSGQQIQTAFGRERHWMVHHRMIWPERVVADCIGDGEGLEALLAGAGGHHGLTHLGALARIGAGKVKRWRIEPGEDATAGTQRVYGQTFDGAVGLMGRCTPPYFWRHAQEPVFATPDAMTAL